MKTKRKKSIGNTDAPASPIIIKSGGSGVVMPIVGVASLFAGYFFVVKPYLAERATDKAEGDTSDEAKVANQFKSVFGERGSKNWHVADKDYNAAALLLNDANKKRVFEIYKDLTDRNLSDDIANHIAPDVKAKADKIQAYNSKPGKLFSITPEGSIKFEIVKGDKLSFPKGSKSPVSFYNNSYGIILNEINSGELNKKLAGDPKTVPLTVKVSIQPSSKIFTVIQTKQIPYNSIKLADDLWKYVRPYVKVSKTFAAVQVLIGKDPKGNNVIAWVDARELATVPKTVKGLSGKKGLNEAQKNLL